MKIKNHRLADTAWKASPNIGGKITPRFIVIHYTGGYGAGINTMTRKGSKVSAHVFVDLEGKITQLVPFNVKAFHAGPSSHMGYTRLNAHSIGIEIVNIGFLKKVGSTTYQDAYGNIRDESYFPNGLLASPHSRVGSGTFYWPRYAKAQLEATDRLVETLVDEYPILDIVTHEEIDTRKWKTDPGPAFPMNLVKRHVADRDVDEEMYEVTASLLNVRGGPGTKFGVLGKLRKGARIDIVEHKGDFGQIEFGDTIGWLHMGHLRRV